MLVLLFFSWVELKSRKRDGGEKKKRCLKKKKKNGRKNNEVSFMKWMVDNSGHMIAEPGHRGSHRTLAVLLHNDAVLGQLLLDENDFLLSFHNEIAT